MIDRTPLPLLNTSLIPLFFPFSSLLICFHVDGWRRLRRSRAVSHCTKRRPSRLEKTFPSYSKTTTTEESRRRCDVLSFIENLSYRALRPSSILHQLHTDFPLARGFVYFYFYSTGNPLDDSISTLPENGRLRNIFGDHRRGISLSLVPSVLSSSRRHASAFDIPYY